ncbi:MAG: ABC transporter ATP-binding protein [Flavisolibacter sp.]
MVLAEQLVKRYKNGKSSLTAVKGISFKAAEGELFGLIGPDGAGKTSIFRILTTLLLPDGGRAEVDGSDVVKDFLEIRKKIGYMPGRFSLYQDLTVEENLQFFATIFGTSIQENYNLIRDIYIQIEPFKQRKAGQLSGGMKQKLALCCALIHRPRVLFLDEPTTGVDAVSRKEFWDMLQQLKASGICILVSTPYMDEASRCDLVALIQEGSLLSMGTPDQVRKEFNEPLVAVKGSEKYSLLGVLEQCPGIEQAYSFGEYHHAILKKDFSEGKLQHYLVEKGMKEVEVRSTSPTIEDCFLKLMQHGKE